MRASKKSLSVGSASVGSGSRLSLFLRENTNEFTLVAVLYNYLDLKIELQIIILTFYYINEQ